MKKRLVFLRNENEMYLLNKAKEIYTGWGMSAENMIRMTSWDGGKATSGSLFGETFALLDLTDKKDGERFLSLVKTDKRKKLFKGDDWYGNGLIIITTIKTFASIRDLVRACGGYEEYNIDSKEAKGNLLSELGLNKELQNVVSDYVGEDYQDIIMIKSSLNGLSAEERKALTIEALYSYLPNKKGEVPPWDLVKHIIEGNFQKALDSYERIVINTVPFVLIAILKSKFAGLYQYKVLSAIEKLDEKSIFECMGIKNQYAVFDYKKPVIKGVSIPVVESINKNILEYEYRMKDGNMKMDTKILMRELVAKIVIAIKNNVAIC